MPRSVADLCLSLAARVFVAATLAAVADTQAASARILPLDSIEWMTLSSHSIAIMHVMQESASTGVQIEDHSSVLELERTLRGNPPHRYTDSAPHHKGDRILVFWRTYVRAPEDTLKWTILVNLTRNRPSPHYSITRDFHVLHSADSVLSVVEERLKWLMRGRPLGDQRRLTIEEAEKGHGRLTWWMPDLSGAQEETHFGSFSLTVPADHDCLPRLLKSVRSPIAEERASAARKLAQYPGAETVRVLRRLLSDDATTTISEWRGSPLTKRDLHPHVVRAAAYLSLRELGISVPKPPGLDEDERWADDLD